jgi:hypothetical protein
MVLKMPGGGVTSNLEVTHLRTVDDISEEDYAGVVQAAAEEVGGIAEAYGLKPEAVRWLAVPAMAAEVAA